MHIHAFDQFRAHASALHRLDPRVKVLLTVGYILSNALLPDGSWLAFAAAWLLLLWSNERAHLGLGYTFKRSFVAFPFAIAAISAIFSPSGNSLAEWNLGFVTLVPTDFGVVRFFSILVRSWLSVQMAILLVTTTQFPDLIHAFEHLKAPRTLTTIIAFLYRYLFVLTDEAYRLMRAREARSAGLPGFKRGGSLFWRAKITGEMAGQLFLRSYERSDRIYNAMLARGYTGHIRTLNPHTMQHSDWLTLFFSIPVLLLIQLIGWYR
ncbi:MAG: cobalt ECF transporter T component CbiQ [Anaerolineae bacterium]|nr:cobalt ECF transporter T component CbiQ [Anaerolineae bacterium]MBL6965985.1 cobalt ECF transporter T component CbiQ [Anaerolineales bacterium]